MFKENHLYQSKIWGPYEGCTWCWEYMFFKNNTFHYIKFGLDLSEDRLKEVFTENNYEYDLLSKEGIKEFITECNMQDIVYVFQMLLRDFGIKLETDCPKCGINCIVSEMISTSEQGNGGIGVENTHYICNDCYVKNLCDNCGEYSDDIIEVDGGYLCEYCSLKECKVCGMDFKVDELNKYGVCSECVDTSEYKDIVNKYETDTKRYIKEKEYQMFLKGCENIKEPILEF